jgi:LysM repeat protein
MRRSPALPVVFIVVLAVLSVSCTAQRPAARQTAAQLTAAASPVPTSVTQPSATQPGLTQPAATQPVATQAVASPTVVSVPTTEGGAAPTPTPTLVVQATIVAGEATATPTSSFGGLAGGEETPQSAATATPEPTSTPVAAVAAAPSVQHKEGARYTVQRGDTLFSIAQRFGTTVDAIKSANGLTSDSIFVGQELVIPGAGMPSEPEHPSSGHPRVHIVQPGENLFRIALRYNTTVDELAEANHITNPWFIYVGQELRIPGGGDGMPPMPPGSPGRTHVVQPGETLYSIAVRYDTTVQALMMANNLSNSNLIYVGQTLNVP